MLATIQPSRSFEVIRTHPDNHPKADRHLICERMVDYTKESERLKSFINWPNRAVTANTLAKAGFYYLGVQDIVRCAFCGVEGNEWGVTDSPMEDHRLWRPGCSFVRKLRRNSSESSDSSVGHDTCGKDRIEIFPKSVADDELLEKLGANKTRGPRHKEQCLYESRLKSFANWPKCLRQKPVDLAEAGFFYRGTGDQTLCFSCGGGLNDWEESDDPWEQHAMWFPKCNYLLMKKGQDFVNTIRRKQELAKLESKQEEPSTSSGSFSTPSATPPAKEIVKSDNNVGASQIVSVPSSESREENNKSSEDSRLCKICYKNELAVLFLPCGHIVACVDCATALSHCAVCRTKIQATVRAFLP